MEETVPISRETKGTQRSIIFYHKLSAIPGIEELTSAAFESRHNAHIEPANAFITGVLNQTWKFNDILSFKQKLKEEEIDRWNVLNFYDRILILPRYS